MDVPLPRTATLIEQGIDRRLHLGAQLYVSLNGSTIADLSLGHSRPNVPLQPTDLMLWLSAGKPIAAIAIAQLWERGQLTLDDPVSLHIPEFAQRGKEKVIIRHLLTHTAGLRGAATSWSGNDWTDIIHRICQSPLEPDWQPGRKAGYHIASTWYLLGELVRRIDGRPFNEYVRAEVFLPLAMTDSWIGMSPNQFRAYGDRLAPMYVTDKADPDPSFSGNTEEANTLPRPGANARGPMNELARLYEYLLAPSPRRSSSPPSSPHSPTPPPPHPVLLPQTIEALTARHRVGLYDHTFRHTMDWSLGFIPNNDYHGDDVPYAYGPHASPRTFGHSGSQSSVAFADPEHHLAVALAFNGLPGEQRHQERIRSALAALYEDLGLAP